MVLTYSLIPGVGSPCPPLFRKASQEKKQSPFFCSWLPSDPCFHPFHDQAACLPGNTVFLCFISVTWLSFRTSNFRDPVQCGLALILWGKILSRRGQWWFVPEKQLRDNAGVQSLWKGQQNSGTNFAALIRFLCSYASEQGSTLAPASSLVPGEAMSPVPNALQEGELFLSV